ncbi:dipeptide epimerase [Nocardioides mangrovicus]|uniref:Dipeptide epimerase n=1 Tax=Nocardioides mangrovicus TaxID=2478913 RepID=A0A3L8P714_9ACTN|nr:dipeptide epimerase [Nocardioides mangrovicus]RLV51015.1 dipeptide epimerase [Nocardioides mangrovicus]
MSRVVAVRTRVVCERLHTTFVTALRRTDTIDSVLVEVEDGDGAVGLGEAPGVWRVTGESLPGIVACVEGPLAEALIGREADDLHALTEQVREAVVGNHGAKAAVDVALHDLAARRLGVPLVRYLGGHRLEVPTDVTLAAGSAEALAASAATRTAEGFTALKLKVGTDAATDVARVRAVREAVGPEVTIRLDANQGWSPKDAVRVVETLEDAGCGVELVEQPVAAADLPGLAYVTAHVATPVMADEAVFGLRDLTAVIERRAADLVNVKLAKAGGLVPARALLELATAHQMGTMVGSMMETGVGVAAAASLVSAVGTTCVSDLDAAWWLAGDPPPLAYGAGTVHLSPEPGLGPC